MLDKKKIYDEMHNYRDANEVFDTFLGSDVRKIAKSLPKKHEIALGILLYNMDQDGEFDQK